MRIGSDCPVSAKFIDCRKPLSQASIDTGDHLAVEEETSVKVQLTEEGKVARITGRWRHVLITLEVHPPCFLHFLMVCCYKISFSSGSNVTPSLTSYQSTTNVLCVKIKWIFLSFFSLTVYIVQNHAQFQIHIGSTVFLYSLFLPWSLVAFSLGWWYIYLSHHIPK